MTQHSNEQTFCVHLSHLETWEATRMVILIDAAISGAEPGTMCRFNVNSQPVPMGFCFHSTKAFGIAEARELARALQQLPMSLIVYTIVGKHSFAGISLSPEVAEAAKKVVAQVMLEVSSL